MRIRRWVFLGFVLTFLALFIYIALAPQYELARADRERVEASDAGAFIGGHLTLPR